jgi:cell division transport system permease protein
MNDWLTRHLQNALGALGQLSRQPIATALTVAVIGIALALPASLQVLVQSAQRLAGNWEGIRDFSIYLEPGSELSVARALAKELAGRKEIAAADVISADDALAGFRADPAFGAALQVLKGNPLPHTLTVRPAAEASAEDLAKLKSEITARPSVDLVQLDTQWLERLSAILAVVRRAIWMAGGLLVLAVVVIIGNTIRLDIQNRRQEIEVSKLLGATDAFVRRPFLYIGLWYGALGGVLALVLLAAGLVLLSGPLERLLSLYGGSFGGFGLSPTTAFLVLGGGVLSGLVGAWLAVARHLSAIQPTV